MQSTTLDELETDFGTAILSDLTGQHLTRNRQAVRLFDQTRHGSEYYFRADKQGKPYIQNFAEGKRYYPVTAYCQLYGVDYRTAKDELCRQYGLDNGPSAQTKRQPQRAVEVVPAAIDYLSAEVYGRCQRSYERNGLYQYLTSLFDEPTAAHVFERYRLGTSRRWQYAGSLATCLPQFDTSGRLRQVKVIPFHPLTGRRAKRDQDAHKWNPRTNQYEPDDEEKVWFAGRRLSTIKNPNLQQCYFGEHLLAEYPDRTVAIVEGESTALVCSAIWPQYVWLATGGSTGGKWYAPERFNVLQGRKVVLWPDTGKYADWSEKARPLQRIAVSVRVSRYVEDNAPDGAGNFDLRDLLTNSTGTLVANLNAAHPRKEDEPETTTETTLRLVESPNRASFAHLLGIDPADLPLYRLSRS